MIQHIVFPTIVGQSEIKQTPQEKDKLLGATLDYLNRNNGFSNESTSDVDLQTNEKFSNLYADISKKVGEYLESMNVQTDNLEINITKSWLNIVEEQHTPVHSHDEAHFSFSYYLNIPEGYTQAISFLKRKHPTEPFVGFFQNTVEAWNGENGLSFSIVPTEGTFVIFPSRLDHKTVGDGVEGGQYLERGVFDMPTLHSKRVCIAGDVILSSKQTSASYAGLQPIGNWRTF